MQGKQLICILTTIYEKQENIKTIVQYENIIKILRQIDYTKYDVVVYHLKDELIQIYEGKPALVVPGIYWVMDIFKIGSGLKWNHYLVVVESDSFYPVAEFCEVVDSTWIKDAIPYIKDYFAGFELEPIEITPYRAPKQRKTGWSNKR